MDYLEELTNEYDNIEDVAREQGIEFDTLSNHHKENEDEYLKLFKHKVINKYKEIFND